MIAEAIAEGTDGRLTRDKVVEMIQTGTTLNPRQAKDVGVEFDIILQITYLDPSGGQANERA
jgi:hypothetical protein